MTLAISKDKWEVNTTLGEVNYSEDLKYDHLKSLLFEGHISNGPVFKWSAFTYGYSYGPNHLKAGPFENRTN